jgi:membrane protein required for colicin V production
VNAIAAATTTTNWLDPAIIGIMAVSAFYGLWRGLLRSMAGLVGIVLAALFAGQLAAHIDPALKQANIQHPPLNANWAFVIAFVAIIVAVELAANVLVVVERFMLLGWVDRLGGAAFGLARGVLFCMILLAGLAQFNSKQFNDQIKNANTAVWLWKNVPALTNMLPPGMRDSTIRLVEKQAPFLAETLGISLPGGSQGAGGFCLSCWNLQPVGSGLDQVGSGLQ